MNAKITCADRAWDAEVWHGRVGALAAGEVREVAIGIGSGPAWGIAIEWQMVSVSFPTKISLINRRRIFCCALTSRVSALDRNGAQKPVSVPTSRRQWAWSVAAACSDPQVSQQKIKNNICNQHWSTRLIHPSSVHE